MTPRPLRVLVTRPAPGAASWMEGLRARGFEPVALPLLAIAPAGAAAQRALQAHWARAADYRAFMFVSAAAVEHFFKQKEAVTPVPRAGVAINSIASQAPLPRCWATGPGTVAALRRAGVPEARIDAPALASGSFDSEGLWALARPQLQAGDRVLVVRGGDAADQPTGRAWLARQIEAAGAVCEQAVAYRRLVPDFSESERQQADAAATDGAIWLFSSSEAIANLQRWRPALDWREARAVATHPRIAQAALAAGFGTVRSATPLLDALGASIESWR